MKINTNASPWKQILSMHGIVLAKTRAGKSSALRLIVEALLDDGKPVTIIDPKGDWFGLKLGGNGKSAGYPVVIFGGSHADVPVNARSGRAVAELVSTGNRPCIIDLGGWTVADRTEFFIGFSEGLFAAPKSPRWLVIDECHNFAPQGKIMDPRNGLMLHWANRLMSEGGGKGLVILSASQRPQKVHKDYVTGAETLIAMRAIHPLDRRAIKDWIDGCQDAEKGGEVLASLAQLERGEGWIWSPEAKYGPVRVRFPMFKTYDSFAAPTASAQVELRGWAEVDLDEVRGRLAEVVKEAEANDPKLLRRRIAELETQIKKKQHPVAVGVDMAAVERSVRAAVARTNKLWDRAVSDANKRLLQIVKLAAAIRPPDVPEELPVAVEPRAVFGLAPSPKKLVVVAHPATGDNGALTGPERRILNALGWCMAIGQEEPLRALAACAAGYAASSNGFKNPLSALKTKGLIAYVGDDRLFLTVPGRHHADPESGPSTRQELHDRILNKLTGPERRILSALLEERKMTREDLASRAGYAPSSNGFKNPLSALRSKGLIDYPDEGTVKANEALFPPGL